MAFGKFLPKYHPIEDFAFFLVHLRSDRALFGFTNSRLLGGTPDAIGFSCERSRLRSARPPTAIGTPHTQLPDIFSELPTFGRLEHASGGVTENQHITLRPFTRTICQIAASRSKLHATLYRYRQELTPRISRWTQFSATFSVTLTPFRRNLLALHSHKP